MPGIRARYWNAGHLLGSASIELEFAGEGHAGQPLRILASGDIGPDAKLLQPRPEAPAGFRLRHFRIDLRRHATGRRSRRKRGANTSRPKFARRRRPTAPCSSRPLRSSAPRS